MRMTWLPLALVAGLAAGCGGTGDDFPREPISGTVTLDGQPLASGNIQLLPTSDAQQSGAMGTIKAGAFSIPEESGPVPGSYKVSITSDSGAQPQQVGGMPGGAGTPNVDLIPPRYNAESTLTAEVKAGGPNTLKFDLQSK